MLFGTNDRPRYGNNVTRADDLPLSLITKVPP